jgi:T5SS/PEP-CTERM-associated repeat protein
MVGVICCLVAGERAGAGTFAWRNPPVSGPFNAAGSWQSAEGNGGYPGPGDFAIFRAGTYTVTCDGSAAGISEFIGAVTVQLDGGFDAGNVIQGGNPVVLQGGGTLRATAFSSLGEGSLQVNGSGLDMSGFDFGIRGIESRIIGTNGATIVSSGQVNGPVNYLPRPLLEDGSSWHHTGALYVGLCFVNSGSLLAADELNVRAQLDGGRLQAGRLNGGGQMMNGSTVTADTASLNDWLLDGGGNRMLVSGSTVPGLNYADISIKAGAVFTAGALADNAWYTVDGTGSSLAVAGGITADGPQKVTLLNQGQGSAGSLHRTQVIVRDPGTVFNFSHQAEDSALSVSNGGRVNGGRFVGPTVPTRAAGCTVLGVGSALVLNGNFELGSHGQGSMVIDGGGRIECATGVFDGGQPGMTNVSSVFGPDSFFNARLGLVVGHTVGVASLNVGNGGRMQVRGSGLAVGGVRGSAGGEGRMMVEGGTVASPSALDCRETELTSVGVSGKGLLQVRTPARMLATRLTVGLDEASDGTVDVIGSNASLVISDALVVGGKGLGRMTLSAGSTNTAAEVRVGSNPGANLLRLTGAGTTLTLAKSLQVGNDGVGQLTVQQRARVILTGAYSEPNFTEYGLCEVGVNAGATGSVAVDGAGSALLGTQGFLNIGFLTAGHLTVTNGAVVDFAAMNVGGAQNGSSSVTISGAGSVVRVADSLGIGAPFPGPAATEATVSAGGLLVSNDALSVGPAGVLRLTEGSAVVGMTSETPIPGTAIVANRGLFLLGGRVVGSIVVRQGGRLLPGFSPGKAVVEGAVTFSEGAVLEVELGGTGAGVGYDQIEATGAVTLAGGLEIVFRDGFAPSNGQVFEVVKGGAILGDFATVAVRGLAPGFSYALTKSPDGRLLLTANSNGVAATQPELTITRPAGGAEIVVSWPKYVSGWSLQRSASLKTDSWLPIAAPNNSLTVPVAGGAEFFRLITP